MKRSATSSTPAFRIMTFGLTANTKRLLRLAFFVILMGGLVFKAAETIVPNSAKALPNDDKAVVSALDTEYQAAVRRNDAASMERLLANDFILVTGSGKSYTKGDLLEEARSGRFVYEHQEDSEQTVRIWGDTAVVTGKLWAQGTENGKAFNYKVWFSDTYVRTKSGWLYVFGQSSLRLSENSN